MNPYTFVPFPGSPPQRSAPHGHRGNPGLLSGTLRVRVTARTPLLVRDIAGQGDEEEPRLPQRPDGTPMIPGSSWKGAIRSLHETLTGSCLRVFDPDFLPVYRDAASSADTKNIRMAVVEEHPDETKPPLLRLCESGGQKQRLTQEQLEALNSAKPLVSGARLDATFGEQGELTGASHNADGDWVVLLSDSRARDVNGEYRAHVRKRTSQTARVTDAAWERYSAEVAGADELRPQSVLDAEDDLVEVIHPHPRNGSSRERATLGKRYRVAQKLRPGQPVWVRLAGGEITQVQHGMLWRHRGSSSSGARIPGFAPCRYDRELCPSCRVFGSADTVARAKNQPAEARRAGLTPEQLEAEQRSYAGHVRFGDALADGEVEGISFDLAPLGSPRPGAGQFYLVNGPSTVGNVDNPPLREWGSAADRGAEPRALRGRKHYWHTELGDRQLPDRGQASDDQKKSQLVSRAVAFPRGTELTMTISFTDLDEVQLGGLLAALQPRDVLGRQVWQHVGGGRPLGFGSCVLAVDTAGSAVWRSASRYGGGGSDVPLDVGHFTDSFRDWVQHELPDVHEVWPALAKALDPEAVDVHEVSYPPGAPATDDETEVGFEFWTQSGGERRKDDEHSRPTGYPLIPLPDVTAEDQTIRYVPGAKPAAVPMAHPPNVAERPRSSTNQPKGDHDR